MLDIFKAKKISLVYIKKIKFSCWLSSLPNCTETNLFQIFSIGLHFNETAQCILVKMHFYFIKFDLSWDTNSDAKCLWFLKYFSLNLNALNDDISSITTILPPYSRIYQDKYFSGNQNKINLFQLCIFSFTIYFLSSLCNCLFDKLFKSKKF